MKPDKNEHVTKKAYNPPQLQVYGDLRRITNAVFSGNPTMDGNPFPADRTS
jgi:hypothetical protein